MNIQTKFIDTLIDDIANNRLEFPTLPEVALRVRKQVDNPDVTTAQIIKALGTDAVLTSRLIQVANSALFSGLQPVQNVQAAISRLGLLVVRNLVTSIAMKLLYQNNAQPGLKKLLQATWLHNTKVASLSHVLARKFTKLRPDEVMLAGLIHDIGSLPIIKRAAKVPELVAQPALIVQVIERLHTELGRVILESWHFPASLVAVAFEHEDQRRDSAKVDYVDIVMVANLHSHLGTTHRLAKADWSIIPIFEKLGLTPEESIKTIREAHQEVSEVQRLLS